MKGTEDDYENYIKLPNITGAVVCKRGKVFKENRRDIRRAGAGLVEGGKGTMADRGHIESYQLPLPERQRKADPAMAGLLTARGYLRPGA